MTNSSTPIDYFKKEAKKLFRKVQNNEPEALARAQQVLTVHRNISLMRIQHVIAIESGFSKWEELIGASTIELQSIIEKKKTNNSRRNGTSLGNFFRGPGFIPTLPHFSELADMFDKMTTEEQQRYLDKEARAMRLFDRR